MESIFVFGIYFLICISQTQRSDDAFLNHDHQQKKRIVLVLAFAMILLGALRNMNTGIDTIYYMRNFSENRADVPISTYWEAAKSDFFSEQGFYILERLFYEFLPNAQLWMTFLCTLFVVPCAILIYRYSECPPVSFVYLIALFIYTFAWQGLRQNVGMSICLFAFLLLLRKRSLKNIVFFVLLVLFASSFHRSSLAFLLAIPALYMKTNKSSFFIIAAAFVVTLAAPYVINYVLLNYLNLFDKVQDYAGGNASHQTYTMFFILLIIYIPCYIMKADLIESAPENTVFLNLSVIGIVFQAMAVVIAEMFRISYYFSVFNMLLLANTAQLAWKKYPRQRFRFFAIAFLIFIFFGCGGFDYWFAWQTK